ncbi:MAG: spore germination protein [Thermaerobacter sp.]|nr:spore germination protein [Thermaerobacter sp.]
MEPRLDRQGLAVGDLEAIARHLKAVFGPSDDFTLRAIRTPGPSTNSLLAYIDGLIDPALLDGQVVQPLLAAHPAIPHWPGGAPVSEAADWAAVIEGCLSGRVAVFRAEMAGAVMVDIARIPHRAIDRAQTEMSVRGPQEAFADVVAIQFAQLRCRLPTPDLVCESLTRVSQLPVPIGLAYLQNVVQPDVVSAVRLRLRRMAIDAPINSTRIGAHVRDRPWAIFPTVRYTERVDWAALELQQGKVAILVAGDPFVITLPTTLADFYRTTSDYSSAWYDTSLIRVIRLLGWAFGIYLPAIYIALTEVNPDLISPKLFDLVAGSHTALPFTPLVEVVVMILVIEVLREAALRLPKILASTIGTVGAIVVGTAVVKAGFVSPQIIVLMTLTALSLFSAPTYELIATWRLVGWIMLLSGFVLGMFGIILATFWVTGEMVTLSSYGVPYLVPYSPFRPKDWSNTLWRVPWTRLVRRLTEGRGRELRWARAARRP